LLKFINDAKPKKKLSEDLEEAKTSEDQIQKKEQVKEVIIQVEVTFTGG